MWCFLSNRPGSTPPYLWTMQLEHRSQYRTAQISWACCWGYSLVLQPDYIWQATKDCIAPLRTITQHHISSWDNIWLPQSSWFVYGRDMDILIPTKQRQLDAKTERLYRGQWIHICLSQWGFYLFRKIISHCFTLILWYIDVYKEIFVLWHCVMPFLTNSVYIQSVYIHNLFSTMRGFLQCKI